MTGKKQSTAAIAIFENGFQDITAERFLERVNPLAPQRAPLRPECIGDRRRLRQEEFLDVKRRDEALPGPDPDRKDGDRREPVERCPADPPADASWKRLDDR